MLSIYAGNQDEIVFVVVNNLAFYLAEIEANKPGVLLIEIEIDLNRVVGAMNMNGNRPLAGDRNRGNFSDLGAYVHVLGRAS